MNQILCLFGYTNILNLFLGSYCGIHNFQAALWANKHIEVTRDELMQIFKDDEDFLLETRNIPRFLPKRCKKIKLIIIIFFSFSRINRRKYFVHGFLTLMQADLAEMFPSKGFKGFLLVVDVFSRKVFCQILKTKTKLEVQKAFDKIFQDAHGTPEVLETDR